jgi:hypothetical protein
MANYALLVGIKNGKRELIEDGPPVEIRRKFKTITAEDGYESVAVLDKQLGQVRNRAFVKLVAKKKAKKKAVST